MIFDNNLSDSNAGILLEREIMDRDHVRQRGMVIVGLWITEIVFLINLCITFLTKFKIYPFD